MVEKVYDGSHERIEASLSVVARDNEEGLRYKILLDISNSFTRV